MQRTLMLIKPDAVKAKSAGGIIGMLEKAGFEIKAAKVFEFDAALCQVFYKDHLAKEFFPRLESFMCSGTSWALILEKENAVCALRELMGDVMPEKRVPGTIRYHYGHGITDNGVHGSDSLENAEREIAIIFRC
ncbi:MAG: nucleoside-diphosphate kinase [Candidatus Cloacimonadaceae bacterium]